MIFFLQFLVLTPLDEEYYILMTAQARMGCLSSLTAVSTMFLMFCVWSSCGLPVVQQLQLDD